MNRRALCFVVVVLGGCASMNNTPIQNYVFEMGRQCEHVSSGWRLERVDSSGHYWIRGEGPAGIPLFQSCMKEQFAKRPFNEWLKAQNAASSGEPPLPGEGRDAAPAAPARASAAALIPLEWKPGYQWTYRYASPVSSGTFAWTVNREEVLDGTSFYVVTSGSREIYFRKSDFAHFMDKVNGEVDVRNMPPVRHVSASAGEKWENRYIREAPKQQSTQNLVRVCEASGPETVTVPAGTFATLKTTCTSMRTGDVAYEVWYSPAVKQMVRDRARFSYGWRERELIGLRLYPDRLQ